MKRRTVVLAVSSAGIASLAGCLFDESGSDGGHDYEAGDLEVVIDGEPVDLTADRFQSEHAENSSIDFHFHEFDDQWYMEGEERLTFAEAIGHIPHFEYENDDGDHVVSYDGTRYDGGDPETELTFERDGEAVDPTVVELYDGDELRLEITTGA
ncbi:hypothetical protein [Halopiger goleimassiliensis]|uniref:hypothetical protein n=1 Tax=Halopiger goleimassiliensis TaxID=1293048 RepID=UPI000677F5A1|nr:hypothetical protein [Halopiger goleimassiliensis]